MWCQSNASLATVKPWLHEYSEKIVRQLSPPKYLPTHCWLITRLSAMTKRCGCQITVSTCRTTFNFPPYHISWQKDRKFPKQSYRTCALYCNLDPIVNSPAIWKVGRKVGHHSNDLHSFSVSVSILPHQSVWFVYTSHIGLSQFVSSQSDSIEFNSTRFVLLQ